jgi:hypothetical protein
MDNVFVYLCGPPGVGKYTVGKLLAGQMPARLVDNHYWNNPIFEIVEADGKTPLPAAVWDRANSVRLAVLETIATMAPPQRNFVFTHAISRSGGGPMDFAIAGQILTTAERRKARTLVVRLTCAAAELAERIESPGRAERLKQIDGGSSEQYANQHPIQLNHDWVIDIDTTQSSAAETTRKIMQVLGR